jgi:hypothetical protein
MEDKKNYPLISENMLADFYVRPFVPEAINYIKYSYSLVDDKGEDVLLTTEILEKALDKAVKAFNQGDYKLEYSKFESRIHYNRGQKVPCSKYPGRMLFSPIGFLRKREMRKSGVDFTFKRKELYWLFLIYLVENTKYYPYYPLENLVSDAKMDIVDFAKNNAK